MTFAESAKDCLTTLLAAVDAGVDTTRGRELLIAAHADHQEMGANRTDVVGQAEISTAMAGMIGSLMRVANYGIGRGGQN